jgi:hypothetical protein
MKEFLMNPDRFDHLARWLGTRSSRRHLIVAIAGSALGVAATRATLVEARKGKRKRKHKAKKPRPNAFGCLEVGDACKTADQCCSGICAGKKGKKQCRAHDTGPCDQGTPGLCESVSVTQTRCDNNANCFCIRTTADSHICGTTLAPSECVDCKKDADCAAMGFPPGTACASVAEGNCAGLCETGTACIAPCGSMTPEP